MATPFHSLDVRLRLLNARRFRTELAAAGGEFKTFADSSVAANARILAGARGLRTAGRVMTRNLTLPIAAFGAVASKAAMDFDQQMTLIETQAGAPRGEINKTRQGVLDLSKEFGIAPEEMAKSLFHLESIGQHYNTGVMKMLRTAAMGSVVGLSNLEDLSTTLGGAWLANIQGAGNFEHVMAQLSATVGSGNIHMQDLVQAIGTGILPVAKEAGYDITDVTSALAVLTDEGMPASTAMRLLRTSLRFLNPTSAKAKAALDEMGLSAKTLFDTVHNAPAGEHLLAGLQKIRGVMSKMPGGFEGFKAQQGIGDIIPSGRGVPLLVLLNQLPRLIQKMKQQQNIVDRFGSSVNQQLKTPAQRMKIVRAEFKVAEIQFGEAFLPIVMKLANAFSAVARWLDKLSPGTKKWVVDILAVTAAAGPLLWLLGGMTTGAVTAYKGLTKVWAVMRAIWLWQKRVAAGNLLTSWASQPRNALGQFSANTWKQGVASRFGVLGRIAGIAFRVAFLAAAAAIAYELYKNLVGPFNSWLEDKFGVLDATDPTNGKAQAKADNRAARMGRKKKPGAGYIWHIKSAQEPWEGWVLRKSFHKRPAWARGWGGTVSAAGDYLVGERGPETIQLPPGARVQPLTPAIAAAFGHGKGGDGGSPHFHLYIDGREITSVVTRVEKRTEARK